MGDFSAAWLALREPIDHAARSPVLTRDVLRALPAGDVRILDLACGTGSNMRYVSGVMSTADRESASTPAAFEWTLVDHDPTLLALVAAASNVTVLQRDLQSLDGDLFAGRALVTASALLDLVSEAWLQRLAMLSDQYHCTALFALTYDGRMTCVPTEPEDAVVRDLVNRHQHTDKGLGPALGPAAVTRAVALFRDRGYHVLTAASDWLLDDRSAPRVLQRQLIEGWAEAASAIAPEQAEMISEWRARRDRHVAEGRSILRVGHQDVAALPRRS